VFATPRDAATVILVRPAAPGPHVTDTAGVERSSMPAVEVFLLRRRKAASFMGGAFVFPGGAADPGETDPRVTAARELFEEAGVLLAQGAPPAAELAALRVRVLDGAPLAPLLEERGLAFDVDSLAYFAHWITPSAEGKRFSARFYVAALPAGQEPRFDDRETVDQVWVTPADALARSGELALPPPQLRTFMELSSAQSVDDVFALARARAAHPHPVMPRLAPQAAGFALLLPWDPEYESAGQGDLHLMPAGHPLATGPTRFVMEGKAWKHVYAPGSTPAG
jgi:8-oxo-dGTP pyrophosphatase MutT (NUDIX family)